MQVPLQVTFRHLARSEAVEAAIRERATKLEGAHPDLVSCRVVVEEERLHQRQGRLFGVRIDVHTAGHEFAVTRESHEDAFVAVRDAFDAMRKAIDAEDRGHRE